MGILCGYMRDGVSEEGNMTGTFHFMIIGIAAGIAWTVLWSEAEKELQENSGARSRSSQSAGAKVAE